MARSIWVSPRALQDVADLAVYLGRTNATAASNFLDAFDRLCDVISQSPEIGSPVRFANSRLDGLRVLRLSAFPNHLVFYLPGGESIQVVRVLHGSRDLDAIFE
jgi:toxin ParE1/3/4